MSQPHVDLHLLPHIYKAIRRIAENSSQSVEEVVISSLEVLYGEDEPGILEHFSDEVLWKVARKSLSPQYEARLDELIAQSKEASLNKAEQAELDSLLEIVDRLMLARSKALVLLKQRGHDIDHYLHPNS